MGRPTIEIKIGTERHRLVPNGDNMGTGCSHCSLMDICNSLGATDISLCHSLEMELDKWAEPMRSHFEKKS